MALPKKVINAPKEEVKELVAPKGTAYTIEIEEKKCFLKTPSRATFSKVLPLMSASFGGEVNIVAAGEIILRESTIGGDTEFLTDDAYILPASLKALELFQMKEATLKKS